MSRSRLISGRQPIPYRCIVNLVDCVLSEAWRRDSRLHGEAHWYAVAATGLDLAVDTGADPKIVFAFGLLHDTRRENEARDPRHGPRAAELPEHSTQPACSISTPGNSCCCASRLICTRTAKSVTIRPSEPVGTPTGYTCHGSGQDSGSILRCFRQSPHKQSRRNKRPPAAAPNPSTGPPSSHPHEHPRTHCHEHRVLVGHASEQMRRRGLTTGGPQESVSQAVTPGA